VGLWLLLKSTDVLKLLLFTFGLRRTFFGVYPFLSFIFSIFHELLSFCDCFEVFFVILIANCRRLDWPFLLLWSSTWFICFWTESNSHRFQLLNMRWRRSIYFMMVLSRPFLEVIIYLRRFFDSWKLVSFFGLIHWQRYDILFDMF